MTLPTEAGDTAASPAPGPLGALRAHAPRARAIVLAVAAVGTVLSGFAGYWTVYRTVKSAAPGMPVATPAAVSPFSIVVLPFANQSGDPQKDYIADGLTSSVTADLSRIQSAMVIPVSTAMAYRGKPAPVKDVSRDLGVRYVLQGSVAVSGSQVRINAQLADAASGTQEWAETFDGDIGDIFALQDRVTIRIGSSLGRQMIIVAARESERRKGDPKVEDLMLRARAISLDAPTAQSWREREALYRKVLAAQPEHANAMAQLSFALLNLAGYDSVLTKEAKNQMIEEGGALALKAKTLEPDIPRVYDALAFYAAFKDDGAAALRYAQRRVELDPRDPAGYNNLALRYRAQFQPDKALEALEKALVYTPRGTSTYFSNLAVAHGMLGHYDAALAWAQKSIDGNTDLVPPYVFLAIGSSETGDAARARAAVAEFRRRFPTLSMPKAPPPGTSPEYRQWFEATYLPAWKKAGLP